jgi:lysophospholipase L1-like esterase
LLVVGILLLAFGAPAVVADSDGDGQPDSVDNCPTVANFDQKDTDQDGAGDPCDNCRSIGNPPGSPAPSGHCTTGGQVDDDLDGIGNACDGDFTEADGDGFVNVSDLIKMLGAFGRPVTDRDCPGDTAENTGSCARYDLNGSGEFINVSDLLVMIGGGLFGHSATEQGCAPDDLGVVRCPLPCEAGDGGGPCLYGSARALPLNISAAGDSITQAFAADCTCNTPFWCLACPAQGGQPEHSWFDGRDHDVLSVHDRYRRLASGIGSDKSAAEDGARMRAGSNPFSAQAAEILSRVPRPEHVEIELGGNDICSRECVDPAHCTKPLDTDEQWTEAVRAGLDLLVAGLPEGSTVYFLGVPRVQDLREAGLEKQSRDSGVDCEGIWEDFNICEIVTRSGIRNGESVSMRLAGVAERQRRYNEILRSEAEAYNRNTNGRNPRGIEVVTDYVDETTLSTGTYRFGRNDINGGDCFHPSIAGQNTLSELSWAANSHR